MQSVVRRTIITIFVIFVILILALWGLTPLIASHVLQDYFLQHEADFTAESISVNPFTTTVEAKNISITSKRGQEFEFDSFLIELAVLPLFERKVQVTQIGLEGMHLEIIEEKEGWRIAGALLAAAEEAEDPESEPEDEPADASANPWQVLLPSILLNNCSINLTRLGAEDAAPLRDEIRINRLHISKITGQELNWNGAATLSAAINGATADLSTEFRFNDGELTQWVDIKLMTATLSQFKHYVPAPYNQGNLNLSLIGELVIKHSPEETVLATSTKRFELDRISVPLAQFSIESERTSAEITALQLTLPTNADPLVVFDGKLTSLKTRITTDEDRKLLAAWEALTLTPISFRLEENTPELKIGKFDISNLIVSQNSTSEGPLPALTSIANLTIEDIEASDQSAKINSIELADLDLQFHFDKNRELTTLVTLAEPKKTTTPKTNESSGSDSTSTTEDPAASNPFTIAINKFAVTGDSGLDFSDHAVSPPFKQHTTFKVLTVEGINSGSPNQATHILFEGKTDKYSSIKTDTRIWPFKEKPNADTRTELQEIDLHPLSPYLAAALGYDIESGQLDMILTMQINEGVMDGKAQLSLRKFDLSGEEEQKTQVKEDSDLLDKASVPIPLNIAVGMLKDGNENIELDIPITGDVTDAEFGWGGFASLIFKKALFEATTTYVTKSLIPYGNVLSLVKFAGEQLLKVRVEPLVYPPEAVAPSAADKTFIASFRQLMMDKEDLQVKACSFASPQDLGDAIPEKLSEQQVKQLEALASARGEAFKDAVISDGTVKSSRILLCKPKVDLAKSTQGRIEFEI